MLSRNNLQQQQETELEIGVLASLVAGLDNRDDNVLGFISNLLERLDRNPGFGEEYHGAAGRALAAINDVVTRNGDFGRAYKEISEAVDSIYRYLACSEGAGCETPRQKQSESVTKAVKEEISQETSLNSESTLFDAANRELCDFISETNEYLDLAEAALLELERSPGSREHIDEVFRCFHNIKGISGFLGLKDFQELAHAAEDLMDRIRSGQAELSGTRAQVTFDVVDVLRSMLMSVREAMSGGEYRAPAALAEIMSRLRDPGESSQSCACSCLQLSAPRTDECAPVKKADEVLRVATARLDALIDSVGELVIANGMVQQEAVSQGKENPRFAANVQRLGKIVREIQEQAMGLRMVSLEATFRKLARIARDLSTKSAVPVNFTFEGEETELDRSVVDEMQSPLVHMIRNAIDHGIEPPEERARLGKPESGNVHIAASHQGGNVVIRVMDDGRGLNKEKILEKAVDRGLVKPGAELTDREIYELIFEPGFSTADQVTEISGRGVGMDVVKRSVDRLRGRLEISVKPGRGTTFSIWLPLTMAVIDGMVITIANQHMVIPSIAIQEFLRPHPDQIRTVNEKGEMVLIRGDLLPMFRLHRLFNLSGANEEPSKALILVITDGDRRCALLVDDVVGQQQVVVKPIGTMFDRVPAVSGASIMGDGTVALILDTAGLLRMAREVRME